MHASDDSDPSGCRNEVNSVGETAEESPADLPIDSQEELWTSLNLREADIDGPKEAGPQPERAGFVPQRRLRDVRFGGRPDDEA